LNADLAHSRRLPPDRSRARNQRTVPKPTGGCSAARVLGLRFVLRHGGAGHQAVATRSPGPITAQHDRLELLRIGAYISRSMSATRELRRRLRADQTQSRFEPCLPRAAEQRGTVDMRRYRNEARCHTFILLTEPLRYHG